MVSRVPKLTSFSIVALICAAETCFKAAAICGSTGAGSGFAIAARSAGADWGEEAAPWATAVVAAAIRMTPAISAKLCGVLWVI